jgi:hypothetical protein
MFENCNRMRNFGGCETGSAKRDSVQGNRNDGKEFHGSGVEHVGSTDRITVCMTT